MGMPPVEVDETEIPHASGLGEPHRQIRLRVTWRARNLGRVRNQRGGTHAHGFLKALKHDELRLGLFERGLDERKGLARRIVGMNRRDIDQSLPAGVIGRHARRFDRRRQRCELRPGQRLRRIDAAVVQGRAGTCNEAGHCQQG
jgi:hypothetical protein